MTSVPPPLPGQTSQTHKRAKVSPAVKIVISLFGLGIAALFIVGIFVSKTDQSSQPTVETSLTKDKSKWRLLVPGSELYADEQAQKDFKHYKSANDETNILRMAWEGRAFDVDSLWRAEVLQSANANGASKVRVFSVTRGRTFDMLVTATALIPYDAAAEERANKKNEPQDRELFAKLQRNRNWLGKQVHFAEKTLAYADDDTLWLFLNAELKKGTPAADVTSDWAQLAREGRVRFLGQNDVATVTSIDGPASDWVKIESDGQSFWVDTSSVSLIPTPPPLAFSPEEAEDKVKTAMRGVFGDDLKEAKVTRINDDGFDVDVAFKEEIVFRSFAKEHVEGRMATAFQRIYAIHGFPIKSATVAAYAVFEDKFGGESEGVAYQTRLNAETAKQVHWDKQEALDFTRIWETLYMHPGFRE